MENIINQASQFIIKNLFTILTVLFIPFLIAYIEKEYWSPLAKKKDIWRRFILEDSFIKRCINTYQDIDSKTETPLISIYIVTLALTIYLICQLIISVLLSIIVEVRVIPFINAYSTMGSQPTNYIFLFSLIIITIFTAPLLFYSSWIKKAQQSINSKNYKEPYSDVKALHFICFLLSVTYFLFLLTFITSSEEESYLFASFLIIPFFMFANVRSHKKIATSDVKNIINDMYSLRFPYIQISTLGGEHYIGQLRNIFDNESIRLVCHKNETIILWDAVATITELNEPKEPQKQLSYFKNN